MSPILHWKKMQDQNHKKKCVKFIKLKKKEGEMHLLFNSDFMKDTNSARQTKGSLYQQAQSCA